MSADEIVFEQVRVREPERRRRPDHDPALACLTYEIPAADDLPIFLDHRAADQIERHALRDTSVELGGVLLGKECIDDETGRPFVWIEQAIEAQHYENSQASFTYTHESWAAITRERELRFPQLDIVGWYHTHPDFGIFLSSYDLHIHENFFDQPLQVAYVIDPIRRTRGFFRWNGPRIQPVKGYYVTSPRAERPALARVVNELENYPGTDRPAPALLSPVVEAELLAMLKQPRTHSASTGPMMVAGSGPAVGPLGLLIGMVLATVVIGGGLLLMGLIQRMDDQTRAIEALTKTLAVAKDAAELAEEKARTEAKEEALDSLLQQVRVEGSAESFLQLYARAVADRDTARQQAAIYEHVGRDLVTKNAQVAEMQTRMNQYRTELDGLARLRSTIQNSGLEVAKDADLPTQVQALVERNKDLAVSATPGLAQKYDYAWYAAAGGWTASALLALGLVAVAARKPGGDEREVHGTDRPDGSGGVLR